ncbi:MAG: inositol-3-phosphate synthase, partial [Planctomycetia bacterium]|nr:inositol-3-phosphate synthase [Planctomycetia bacterium]
MAQSRIGIWLVGARGGIASTVAVGLTALDKGLVDEVALVSSLPRFARLGPARWSDFVVAGHEIRDVALADEAMRLATESRAIEPNLVDRCRKSLDQIDRRIRPGTIHNVGPTIAALADDSVPRDETPLQAIARLGHDMAAFVQAEGIAHLVVVNVASTEPPVDASSLPPRWAELDRLLDECSPHTPCAEVGTRSVPATIRLPASSLYAIAALE